MKCKSTLFCARVFDHNRIMLSCWIRFFGPQNRVVTLKLIRYSLLMVLAPLTTFYFSFYVIFKQDNAQLMWCGLLAVLVTNLVIAAYVVMAWNEKDDRPKPKGVGARGSTMQKVD